MMSRNNFNRRREMIRLGALAVTISLLLIVGPICNLAAASQNRQTAKTPALSGDQRVAHVLSRLTFGARPGDFERVKAMGVNAFIAQQLDQDALDDNALIAKLGKLPTLGMATPVIFEQYTPPKPTSSPSPKPAETIK